MLSKLGGIFSRIASALLSNAAHRPTHFPAVKSANELKSGDECRQGDEAAEKEDAGQPR
jgi:hypothetical protein